MDRLEIGEATGARSMRQRFDVSGTSPGEAIRTPNRRAATLKTSILLARHSRRDNHANAATPDSHRECRSFPIQIAALYIAHKSLMLAVKICSGGMVRVSAICLRQIYLLSRPKDNAFPGL